MINLPKSMDEPYDQFYETVSENNIFDSKTTVLLKLASSMSVGCKP
jgi:hypothetical protein